ncbi:hypothetical protein OIU77_027423 [Salix suchowensis]|uniref:C2H2-type domain-containing protein n=1 Tax=Salix suchowensis TaxID=1278906 RepID=A0ABQ9BPJ8_9ROSI|nr:hypothetical protein OIU77_027423 [Salix suchowensis]
MAAEIGLLSMTQLQNLPQSHQNQYQHQQNPSETPSFWMWNPKQTQEDDDSWEVRAFAEDTGNINGTTWPPRSYTCTFCRREFRSAQALGGHMNVHRRDRARLHQTQPWFNQSSLIHFWFFIIHFYNPNPRISPKCWRAMPPLPITKP